MALLKSMSLLLLLTVAMNFALPGIARSQESIAQSQSAPSGLKDAEPADLEAWFDGFMDYALETEDIAGAVITVVDRNGILLSKGYGVVDVASGSPVSPSETLFRAGSVSKLLTWTAVMQLVDEGQIDLDGDVETYVDLDIPTLDRPVTVRDLLTHRAGFSEVLAQTVGRADDILPLDVYLRENPPTPLTSPGEVGAYSNYGAALAGYVVQRVSGMPLEDYFESQIFAPLGMSHSSFRQPLQDEFPAALSSGYALASSGNPAPFEIVGPFPAGSLSSTGEDMGRFIIAHLGDEFPLMSRAARDLMHAPAEPLFPDVAGMTLGFLEQNFGDTRAIGHGGDTQFFHSDLQLFPEAGLGYYISLNSSGIGDASHQIRQALFDEFAARYVAAPPEQLPTVPTAVEHGREVVGMYESSRRSGDSFLKSFYVLGQLQVSMAENGDLLATLLPDPAGQPQRWHEVEPWVWQAVDGGERLVVRLDDGNVTALTMDPYSSILEYTPVPWFRSAALLIPLVLASLAVLILLLLAWPIGKMIRWYHAVPSASVSRGASWLAVRVTAMAVLLVLALWTGLFVYAMDDFSRFSTPLEPWLRTLQWASLAAVLAVGSGLWETSVVWSRPVPWLRRVGSVAFVLAALALTWAMYVGGLFSHSLNY